MTNDRSPRRNFVALLTDFGSDSFYVGVMKAVINHAAPGACMVDITHDVKPYAVDEGSFILASSLPFSPAGAVFLAVVDPGVGGDRGNYIFRVGDRYIVAPDNGLITDLSSDHGLDAYWEIDEERLAPFRPHPGVGNTFLGRDIFAPAAGALAAGLPADDLGAAPSKDAIRLDLPPVSTGKNRIESYGRHIDRFGNVMTGIRGELLSGIFGPHNLAEVNAKIGDHEIRGIQDCYVKGAPGEMIVVLNSWNRIEVSVNRGRADEALSITNASDMHIVLEK